MPNLTLMWHVIMENNGM